MWDLSCPDWEQRMRQGRSLIPDLPLIEDEAAMGLAFFDQLQLPDVPGKPFMRNACGQWWRDLVRITCGSWDPVAQTRYVREIFSMAPKGSSKTTNGAGLVLTLMLMNRRPRAQGIFIGPTQAIADRAYEQAAGMIEASPDLKRRFKPVDHRKTIEDLLTKSEAKVVTFDVNIVTGGILIFALLDELHLLGRSQHTGKVLRQIRGGLEKTPEGVLLITTTQSDEPPQGAFRDELIQARKIRDGKFRGKLMRPTLPVLYEFPADIAADREQWGDPNNWPMVMPNLGKSVHLDSLWRDWQSEKDKGEHAIRVWASQHLNIEIGVGISNDGWRGADFWEETGNPELTLEAILEQCDVVTMGGDGGGLDDLMGLVVVGRHKATRQWLAWAHAFADPKVLERRKDIAAALLDFKEEGSLTLGDGPTRYAMFAAIVAQVVRSGKLPPKDAVGIDPNNAAAMFEALETAGVTPEQIKRLLQGPALAPALYGLELKLDDGTFTHCAQRIMAWSVANAKVEPKGNHLMVTKQISGRSKIDLVIALFEAAILMSWNPEGMVSVYRSRGALVL